jgi:hypothetical protein
MPSVASSKRIVYAGALTITVGVLASNAEDVFSRQFVYNAVLEFLGDGGFAYIILAGLCILLVGCVILTLKLPAKRSYSVGIGLTASTIAIILGAVFLSFVGLLTINVHGGIAVLMGTLMGLMVIAAISFCIALVRALRS